MGSAIITVIFLVGPSVLSCLLHLKLHKKPYRLLDYVMWFFTYAFLIHLFSLGIMTITGIGGRPIADILHYVSGTAKYGMISLAAAITFPNIVLLLTKIEKGKPS
jgi:hypothetical protein